MFVQIIDQNEKIPVKVGDTTFFVRRIDEAAELEIRLKHLPGEKESAEEKARREQNEAEARLDYALVGWEGVRGGDGEEIAITPELKAKLPREVKMLLIKSAYMRLHASAEKEELGNSEVTQGSAP